MNVVRILVSITGLTGRHQILKIVRAALCLWHKMIDLHVLDIKLSAAIGTSPTVFLVYHCSKVLHAGIYPRI